MDYSLDDSLVSDANECIEFKLVRSQEDIRNDTCTFKPLMSHQIFGEKEAIVGYENLKVKLYYTAGWLEMYYGIEYSFKDPDAEPANILCKIKKFYELPMIENLDEFEKKIANDETFKPFGTHIRSFSVSSSGTEQVFEVYNCSNSTPGFKSFYKRLETFVIWFIDAANFIDFDDTNWNFFLVYEKYKSSDKLDAYAAIGYATIYNYYAYPDNIRPRISQVLILPPFQAKGVCSELLQAVYHHYSHKSNVLDFTVEDPSEDFQRVRDYIDCLRVESSNYFDLPLIKQGATKDLIDKLHTLKLSKNQAVRVCEILRLKYLDHSDPEEVRKYRLDIKRRLNQPFQKQQSLMKKCAAAMSQKELKENISTDESRKKQLDGLYHELVAQYSSVIKRLEAAT